jgi:Uma2 family endonuclease
MTADEFFSMPDCSKLYELEEGRLVAIGPAPWRSSTVAATIGALLGTFVREHKLGKVSGADLGTKLASDPDTVRVPDVAFIRAERLPGGRRPRGFSTGASDLVVEVLSPSDRYRKTQRKVREYLAAGARLVWIIEPEDRSAVVYRADGTIEEYGADGVLNGGDLLPGFTLNLAEIWEEVEKGD